MSKRTNTSKCVCHESETSTISAVFSKEADSEDQDFLMLLDRIEKGIWRIETTVADLKISYYQLAQASSIRVSKK
jgi:predicted metalloprotease with PDZ domain